jgi:hypothetical protein
MGFHEVIAEGEAERFEGFGRELAELQRQRAQESGKLRRALHMKPHVCAVGKLVVTAADAATRVGVFASPGHEWPVYVRFSNGASRVRADKAPDVRGFSIKLVGVPGKKLIPGLEDAPTQDFLFINEPVVPFKTADDFMKFQRAAKDGPLKLFPRLIKSFGFGRAFALVSGALKSPKVQSFATHAFHTAAPIAFGPTAAKLALFPKPENADTSAGGDDYLRVDLTTRLKARAHSWTLRAQLFVDDERTPIEDTTVPWTGPFLDLGVLSLPMQDPESPRGVEISQLVESLSFDPWHAIAEHQPLGGVMRARAAAYKASVLGRNAAAEPSSVLAL